MWVFAIYDKEKDIFIEIILKNHYIILKYSGIFFGSEIKFLQTLSNNKFQINELHLNNFLSLGYKSLFKGTDTFFKDVNFLKGSHNLTCNKDLKIEVKKY